MVRRSVLFGFVLAIGVVAGCGKKAGSGGTGKPKIAVSIFPLYDVTRRIAGDRFEVLLVLPPGKSEHGYDATPKEIARLDGTKLGFAVGLDMDGWVENIMTTAGGPRIVRIGDKVPTIPIDVEPIGEDEAHEGEHHDDEHHEGSGSAGSGSGAAKKDDHDDHDKDHDDHDEDHDDHEGSGSA